MQIQIPTNDLKAALNASLANLVSAEGNLAAEARAQVQALVDDLYPLVVSEAQSLLSAANPAVPRAYLAVLQGCVEAAIAKLGLQTIATQRQQIAGALQTAIQLLALLLRAAVVA